MGLALLKFGSPPIMEKYITAPEDIYQFIIFTPWPIVWAYALLGLVTVLGLAVARWRVIPSRPWLAALPLAWLCWQLVSATHTLSSPLTQPTLAHFTACCVCFYLGLFTLSRVPRLIWFWPGLVCGFLLVLAVGWEQHFGGLEETRRQFFLYEYPTMPHVAPEFLKKLESNRIFATLFYPNTLAGALLLLLPVIAGLVAQAREQFTIPARSLLLLLLGVAALGCLYWSGSKGGWLLMLALGCVAVLRLLGGRLRLVVAAVLLLLGTGGFFWKYAGFFERGATSVSARGDYWRAALKTIDASPMLGTGPGTFSLAYEKLKRPEAEMTRLAHNDYLEQGSDSGLPGLLLYTAFIAGALIYGFPSGNTSTAAAGPARAAAERGQGRAAALVGSDFWIWLGVLGWALQCLFEFSLYIPALAWPAFAFMGLLLGRSAPQRN